MKKRLFIFLCNFRGYSVIYLLWDVFVGYLVFCFVLGLIFVGT